MDTANVKGLLRKYLDSMHTMPTPNPDQMETLSLAALREMARARTGNKVTQAAVAKAINKGMSTVQQWESGVNLNGITALIAMQMAVLFGCRIEEVIAAIENTRKLTKEK
jgi:DNA-binding transcriptional regulator YiaG